MTYGAKPDGSCSRSRTVQPCFGLLHITHGPWTHRDPGRHIKNLAKTLLSSAPRTGWPHGHVLGTESWCRFGWTNLSIGQGFLQVQFHQICVFCLWCESGSGTQRSDSVSSPVQKLGSETPFWGFRRLDGLNHNSLAQTKIQSHQASTSRAFSSTHLRIFGMGLEFGLGKGSNLRFWGRHCK